MSDLEEQSHTWANGMTTIQVITTASQNDLETILSAALDTGIEYSIA